MSRRFFYSIQNAGAIFACMALALCVFIPSAMAQGKDSLVIVSPHDQYIRAEFEIGFKAAWKAQTGRDVAIEWQDRGGTVEIVQYLTSTYGALSNADADKGIGIDLAFGGGVPAFEQLKKANVLQTVDLDPKLLAAIPADLNGVTLYDKDHYWFGDVLSTFGILYNKKALSAKHLPEPKTWGDLAAPGYRGQVALADPAKSGSVRVCYDVIIQKQGWTQGWATLMDIAGNARVFESASSAVPNDVANGDTLAGMCIDFYAYTQIEKNGADTMGFVAPAGATATTPDPIGVLRGAPHAAVAKAFVAYVLSPEGQKLWLLKPGTQGGPKKSGLWRLPIVPTAYEAPDADKLINFDPFKTSLGFNIDPKKADVIEPLLGPLFQAAFISDQAALGKAVDAVRAHPENAKLAELFHAAPFEESKMTDLVKTYQSDPREQVRMEDEWTAMYKQRYEDIGKQAK